MKKCTISKSLDLKLEPKDVFDAPALHTLITLGHSFRCQMLASQSYDRRFTTFAWQNLTQLTCDPDSLDTLLSNLTEFVKNIDTTSSRKIEVLPRECPGLCRDECLAVSMIAASQQSACPALKACAYALIENCILEPSLHAAETLGASLSTAGIRLSPYIVQEGLSLALRITHQQRFHA